MWAFVSVHHMWGAAENHNSCRSSTFQQMQFLSPLYGKPILQTALGYRGLILCIRSPHLLFYRKNIFHGTYCYFSTWATFVRKSGCGPSSKFSTSVKIPSLQRIVSWTDHVAWCRGETGQMLHNLWGFYAFSQPFPFFPVVVRRMSKIKQTY